MRSTIISTPPVTAPPPRAAFELLRAASQNLDRKLRDVARDVTDTGELPAPG